MSAATPGRRFRSSRAQIRRAASAGNAGCKARSGDHGRPARRTRPCLSPRLAEQFLLQSRPRRDRRSGSRGPVSSCPMVGVSDSNTATPFRPEEGERSGIKRRDPTLGDTGERREDFGRGFCDPSGELVLLSNRSTVSPARAHNSKRAAPNSRSAIPARLLTTTEKSPLRTKVSTNSCTAAVGREQEFKPGSSRASR